MNKLLFAENMFQWFIDENYLGHDPYQLDQKVFGMFKKHPFLKKIRIVLKPFHSLIPTTLFKNIKPILHPKALGLIISGNTMLFKKTKDKKYLNENKHILKLLLQIRNKEYNHSCWGHPFEWGDKPRYKINEPLICVTAPVGLWLLDYYEVSKNPDDLKLIIDIKTHILQENKWKLFNDGSEAVFYSNVTEDLTYNGASMVALFFTRLGLIDKNQLEEKKVINLIKFIIQGQNPNGSWYYSHNEKKEHKTDNIDNRHTGFILENLSIMYSLKPDFDILDTLSLGETFYLNSLCDSFLPKWTINSPYPIDIHDVGQAIITFDTINQNDLSEELIKFTIEKLSNGKNKFYFKLFRNHKSNKNIFIRWNQAWMYNALCKNIIYND